MTQEQIEQAARRYAERDICGVCFQEGGLDREDSIECMVGAYLAGAESRQAEIDEILTDIEKLRSEPKRSALDEKKEAYRAMVRRNPDLF